MHMVPDLEIPFHTPYEDNSKNPLTPRKTENVQKGKIGGLKILA